MRTREVMVTHRVAGFHRWPDAAHIRPERGYLSYRHRHLFHIRLETVVAHDSRQIEFHDLRDWVAAEMPDGHEWGDHSCEAIAGFICDAFIGAWGDRPCLVEVWEDGENGSRVVHTPGDIKDRIGSLMDEGDPQVGGTD